MGERARDLLPGWYKATPIQHFPFFFEQTKSEFPTPIFFLPLSLLTHLPFSETLKFGPVSLSILARVPVFERKLFSSRERVRPRPWYAGPSPFLPVHCWSKAVCTARLVWRVIGGRPCAVAARVFVGLAEWEACSYREGWRTTSHFLFFSTLYLGCLIGCTVMVFRNT